MKNLVILCAALLALYWYMHRNADSSATTAPEAQESVAAGERPTVAVPAEPLLKYYYHSPLDAPPAPSGTNTDFGYYSTNPKPVVAEYDLAYRRANGLAQPTPSIPASQIVH